MPRFALYAESRPFIYHLRLACLKLLSVHVGMQAFTTSRLQHAIARTIAPCAGTSMGRMLVNWQRTS